MDLWLNSVTTAAGNAIDREAYVRNALEEVARAKSYVVEVLTGPNDLYIRENMLDGLLNVEFNLRKALL